MKNRVERIKQLAADLTTATTAAIQQITVAHRRAQRAFEQARQSGDSQAIDKADSDYAAEAEKVIERLHKRELELLTSYVSDVQDGAIVAPFVAEEE